MGAENCPARGPSAQQQSNAAVRLQLGELLQPPRANTRSGGRAALGCAKRETGVKPKTPKLGDDDLVEAEGGLCGDGALRPFDDLSSLRTKASIDRASPTQFPQQQGQPSYGL